MGEAQRKLTPKQQAFCDEYLIDSNGARAYRAAYPTIKSDLAARVNASRLLTKANVRAYIDARRAEQAAEYQITQNRALEEEASIAFSDIAKTLSEDGTIDMKALPKETTRAISRVEYDTTPDGKPYVKKVWFWDKGRSLERIEKHLGMFEKDNQQKRPPLDEVFRALMEAAPDLAKAVRAELEKRIAD